MFHVPKDFGVTVPFLAISVAALQLWNHLPHEIRAAPSVHILKSLLETHLFTQYGRYNIVLRHEHSCGMAQYKSDGLIVIVYTISPIN